MTGSFRVQLALRAAVTMALALSLLSIVSVVALASFLDDEIDATILSVASIQAASVTDDPGGEMSFHEWDLTPDEAASVRELVRFAQVWQADGRSLLRSQYMTADLPLDTAHLRRASEGELVWTEASFGDVPIRTVYYPLERFGAVHERHVLQVAASLRGRDGLVRRVSLSLALVSVVVTLVTFGGAWWLADRAVRPVHEIIGQAEEIGARSLDRRIQAWAQTREYRRLVDVLNTMLSRIHGSFEAQRRFTSDASHELRSPLTVMRGELELALRRDRDPEEYRRVLESTLEEVGRLSRIAEDLLILARSDSGALRARPEPIDLRGVAESVHRRLATSARSRDVSVAVDATGETTAEADPVLLGQVLWNLLDNAIRFTPGGGRVQVRVEGDGDGVRMAVEDSGPGFPPAEMDRMFERFYRGDPARTPASETGGTGLGLSIVQAVVDAHDGRVEVGNRTAGGARVEVWIPRSRAVDGDEA